MLSAEPVVILDFVKALLTVIALVATLSGLPFPQELQTALVALAAASWPLLTALQRSKVTPVTRVGSEVLR